MPRPAYIPPRKFEGADVYIIGGGPSLAGFDWERLRGKNTIGCNAAFLLGPELCDVCIFGDTKFFNRFRSRLRAFPNPKVGCHPALRVFAGEIQWMPRSPNGLHKDSLGWGTNTGCSAINLALIMGAKRVLLLGFDASGTFHQQNWHDEYCKNGFTTEKYLEFIGGHRAIAQALPIVFPGCEIVNLNPESAIECYPKEHANKYLPENER